MKGFHYVNKSSNVETCDNFEDEICNGGPKYGTRLLNEFRKCLKPCKMITYKDSRIEMVEPTYVKIEKNQANIFLLMNKVRIGQYFCCKGLFLSKNNSKQIIFECSAQDSDLADF